MAYIQTHNMVNSKMATVSASNFLETFRTSSIPMILYDAEIFRVLWRDSTDGSQFSLVIEATIPRFSFIIQDEMGNIPPK